MRAAVVALLVALAVFGDAAVVQKKEKQDRSQNKPPAKNNAVVPIAPGTLVQGKAKEDDECVVFSASSIYCGKKQVPLDLLEADDEQKFHHNHALNLIQAVDITQMVPSPELEQAPEMFPGSQMPEPVYSVDHRAFGLKLPEFQGPSERSKFFGSQFVKEAMGKSGQQVAFKAIQFGEQRTRVYHYEKAVLPDSGLCRLGRPTKKWDKDWANENKVMSMFGHRTKYFNHALDLASSKVAAVQPFISKFNVKLFVDLPTDKRDPQHSPQIGGIYDAMGIWSHKRVQYKAPQQNPKEKVKGMSSVRVKNAYVTCEAPAFHPDLAKDFRKTMKLPKVAEGEKNKVVWISRGPKSAANGRGMDVVNEEQVLSKLRGAVTKLGYTLEVFEKPHKSFPDAINYFSRARVIVGAHGSGLYNQWIAPDDCKIIELQHEDLEDPSQHANWLNSALIGQPYHLMHAETVSSNTEVKNLRFSKDGMEDLKQAVISHLVERPLKVVTKDFNTMKSKEKRNVQTGLLQNPQDDEAQQMVDDAEAPKPAVNLMQKSPFPKLTEADIVSDKDIEAAQAKADLDTLAELKTNDVHPEETHEEAAPEEAAAPVESELPKQEEAEHKE